MGAPAILEGIQWVDIDQGLRLRLTELYLLLPSSNSDAVFAMASSGMSTPKASLWASVDKDGLEATSHHILWYGLPDYPLQPPQIVFEKHRR